MRIYRYLISKISYLLIFGLLISIVMPEVAEADGFKIRQAGKYRKKAWVYLGFFDGGVLLPPKLYFRGLPFAIGFAPPIGLGVGTAIWEGAIPFKGRTEWEDGDISHFTAGANSFFPLYIYWVPYINKPYKTTLYTFLGFCNWVIDRHCYGSSGRYLKYGIGLSYYYRYLLSLGIETGFIGYKNEDYHRYISDNSLYIGVNVGLGRWFGLGTEEIHPPSIQLASDFKDADGNGILSGNEKGILEISISNKGKTTAKDVKLSISISKDEYKDKIAYQDYYYIGKIKPFGKKYIKFPINAKGELPKGEFTMDITCNYKTEWGEKKTEYNEVLIKTAPSAGMIRVAFENISSSDFPPWIIPTPLEYADYQVSYKNGKVSILNLNTGERIVKKADTNNSARKYVKEFFLRWDKESPKIILSSTGEMVRAKQIKLLVRLMDDRKLDEMKVYLNDNLYKDESFVERTETDRELILPLRMGDNTIRIVLTDWVGKKDEKTITFTRIRGGTGTVIAGKLPKGEPPPELVVRALPIDGNNTIVGGNEEGIKVTVTNQGKGIAKMVKVVLEGDDFLAQQWGRERNLEDIKPGETKTATFGILMPTELPRREANIYIKVKEGRGYSPKVIPSLTFNLVPAEITIKPVQTIEDVDNVIP